MIYLFGAIATFIMVFGMEGRGSWSRIIAIIGGILWLVAIIFGFNKLGLKNGFILLIGTLIIGAILTKILKPLLNPHGH